MADSSGVRCHSALINAESVVRPIARVEHRSRYFQTMSLVLFAFVLLGFARTLFLRPLFHVPPMAGWYLYLHGAVLTSWFAAFVAQTSLVAARRTDLHRRLEIVGAILAIAVFAIALVTVLGLPAHFKAGRLSTEGVPRLRGGFRKRVDRLCCPGIVRHICRNGALSASTERRSSTLDAARLPRNRRSGRCTIADSCYASQTPDSSGTALESSCVRPVELASSASGDRLGSGQLLRGVPWKCLDVIHQLGTYADQVSRIAWQATWESGMKMGVQSNSAAPQTPAAVFGRIAAGYRLSRSLLVATDLEVAAALS